MKAWIGLLLCVSVLGCATPKTNPPLTEDERLEQKYAGYGTSLLRSRRMELATFVAHGKPKKNPLLPSESIDTKDPRQELDEIERELLRRFHAGDTQADLSPVP